MASRPLRGLGIDTFSILYRGHYAAPASARSDGLPTGALQSFLRTTVALLQRFNPTAVVCAFDRSDATFRNDLVGDYKAGRSPMPEDLKRQLPLVREGLAALGVRAFDAKGFEADDVLASWASAYGANEAEGRVECTVVSTDKDMLQLVDDARGVRIFNPATKRLIAEREVVERFGVAPSQMIDLQVLMGDKADNIAGVAGIGVKTAARLVRNWGSWQNVVANAHSIPSLRQRLSIEEAKDDLPLFEKLLTLRRDVELPSPLLPHFSSPAPPPPPSAAPAPHADGEPEADDPAPFSDAALLRNVPFMDFLETYELYSFAGKLKRQAPGFEAESSAAAALASSERVLIN